MTIDCNVWLMEKTMNDVNITIDGVADKIYVTCLNCLLCVKGSINCGNVMISELIGRVWYYSQGCDLDFLMQGCCFKKRSMAISFGGAININDVNLILNV